MSFIYNMADTWNAIGTTFNAILINVDNGAGGAPVGSVTSRLLNLKSNGFSVFNVDISGNLYINNNTVDSPGTLPTGNLPIRIVGANSITERFLMDGFGTAGQVLFRTSGGTAALPSNLASNAGMGSISGFGYGGTLYTTTSRVGINFNAAETWSDTAQGTNISFQTTRIGAVAATTKFLISANGNCVLNTGSALATTAVDGFMYIPTCAGPPTGVPTVYTGQIAMIYDTTNDQFWFYNGAWKQPKTPAGAAIVTWQ